VRFRHTRGVRPYRRQSAGWLLFQPDYYDGDVFPSSYAEVTYYYEGISNPEGEYDVAEDYIVCVLHDRLGDELSWLGTTTYTDDWDGGSWSHVGYPGMSGAGPGPPGSCGSASRTCGLQGSSRARTGWWISRLLPVSITVTPAGRSSDGGLTGDLTMAIPPDPYIVAVVSGEGTLGSCKSPTRRPGPGTGWPVVLKCLTLSVRHSTTTRRIRRGR
jgi:hypothetical protein